MSTEKTPFTETMSYPIVFMIVLSIIFVGVLAVLFRLSEPKINAQKQESYQRLVLGLCAASIAAATGKDANQIISQYPQSYQEYIRELELKGQDRPSFAVVINDNVIVRCVDIPGKGLWDKMRCLVAVSPDLTLIKEVSIYEQMETPGLGARISEDWFQNQFKGKQVIVDGKFIEMELISEKQPPQGEQINKVTGATISSQAVLKMLKDGLENLYDNNHTGGQSDD